MAPILTSATGLEPLAEEVPLLERFAHIPSVSTSWKDVEELTETIRPYSSKWPLGDVQVDLFCWIQPLNAIDSALSWILKEHGKHLLLIPPKKKTVADCSPTLESITACPASVSSAVQILLSFSALLLQNSTSKQLYNTSLIDWFAAADDSIADAALHVYYCTALPVQLHKQPHPAQDPVSNWVESALSRLVVLTRGYGTAGAGTGLDWAVGADDAQPLPAGVGKIWYRYYAENEEKTIELSVEQMMVQSMDTKRRKALLSTAELFFLTKTDDLVDPFGLLTEIRLARAAHAQETRVNAVQRRLQAITILLYTVPEVLNGYFPSQPELIVELVSLVKMQKHPVAMQTLSALVSRRDGRLSSSALQELGVAKGQYLGVLPTLLRSCLASINSKQQNPAVSPPSIAASDPALAVGLSYVQAMAVDDEQDQAASFDEVENILTLTASVASSATGITALIDCGLLTTLLAVLECDLAPAYVVAQAVQMMESSVVTHSHAVTAFKDLNGGAALVNRLERETATCENMALIHSLLNCLTIYLHHDSAAFQTMAEPLKKLLMVEDGHVLALACNLISEITNNDPNVSSVVKFVHSSGLAETILNHVMKKSTYPRVPELFMSLPNVLFALALTEEGAMIVRRANPYPHILSIFCNPAYAMPKSRCLLNEMPSTVGASLEDIMRNVDSLKPLVFDAIVTAMNQVAAFGLACESTAVDTADAEEKRTCLIQFIMNLGQILEQILQHDDHVHKFIAVGGFESLTRLYEVSIPPPSMFLHQASSMSCPSISSLHHATTEECLLQVTKCLQSRFNSQTFLAKVVSLVDKHLSTWENLAPVEYSSVNFVYDSSDAVSIAQQSLSVVANVHWITKLLTVAVKAGGPKNFETASAWSRSEKEWLRDLTSEKFQSLMRRLSLFYHKSLWKVCSVRANATFDQRERDRMVNHNKRLRYRLRIVCAEGAVVRDGIDIDSCANVGSLEMGEIVVATDRCINSSGILRYRTGRGWVSEMTRGHGREPIAEVFQIYEDDEKMDETNDEESTEEDDGKKNGFRRVEADVPDIETVAIGILSRGQIVYNELFSAFSRLVLQSTRALSSPISLEEGEFGGSVSGVLKMIKDSFANGFNLDECRSGVPILSFTDLDENMRAQQARRAMYFGCLLSQLQNHLFDDKRDSRRSCNFPLLCAMMAPKSSALGVRPLFHDEGSDFSVGLFAASQCIIKHALLTLKDNDCFSKGKLRVPRSVASSFPPMLSLLRKTVSSSLSSSPTASIMSRMAHADICKFLGVKETKDSPTTGNFRPEQFLSMLHLGFSALTRALWEDPRLDSLPPFLMHPLVCFTGEVIVALEESAKKKGSGKPPVNGDGVRLSEFMARRLGRPPSAEDEFEPSEDIITRVSEMGFSRNHAVEAAYTTRSNDLEVVMERALTSLPPSSAAVQRRQEALAARDRRRAERQAERESQGDAIEGAGAVAAEGAGAVAAEAEAVPGRGERLAKSGDAPMDDSSDSESLESLMNQEIAAWFEHLPTAVSTILARMEPPLPADRNDPQEQGKIVFVGEAEALSVVLSSFLLDMCKKRQDLSVAVMSKLIQTLKAKFVLDEDQESWRASKDSSTSIAVLCQATALMMRAMPKSRILVLKEGMASRIASSVWSDLKSGDRSSFPLWFAPALLILSLLAEPMVIFSNIEADKEYFADQSPDSELERVKKEHDRQLQELQKATTEFREVVFKEADKSVSDATAATLSSFPSYFPLLSSDVESRCTNICETILTRGMESKKLPPSLCQSVLELLHRLLRDPNRSSEGSKLDLANKILSLPKQSKFSGNASMVTMVLRRLVEDYPTLCASMESEIKSSILKFHAKSGDAKKTPPSMPLPPLVESLASLLSREPSCFFRAFSFSGQFRFNATASTDTCVVSLVPQTKREDVDTKDGSNEKLPSKSVLESPKADEKHSKAKKAKAKSAAKSQKRSATPKKTRREELLKTAPTESSSSHICGLVMTAILTFKKSELKEDLDSFLSTSDLLDVLADLVHALPSCASAVHMFRVRGRDKGKKSLFSIQFRHALDGCPVPPRSFVNLLLHVFIPQDLWSIKNDPLLLARHKRQDTEDSAAKQKKKLAIATTKLAQSSTRLILTLSARPGDIRKRVVTDLAFALSGGTVAHGSVHENDPLKRGECGGSATDMHALHAWGELCHAIAAPRSTGKEFESMSSLNMGSVRLLLENGMVHALLYAIKRVRLQHAMSWNTGGILLLPLEILTRPAVTDSVRAAVRMGAEEAKINECLASSDLPGAPAEAAELEEHVAEQYNQEDEMDDVDVENHEAASDEHDEMSVDDSLADESQSTSASSNEDDEDSDDAMSDAEESVDSIERERTWGDEYEESLAGNGNDDVDEEAEDETTEEGSNPAILQEDWTHVERQGFSGGQDDPVLTSRSIRGMIPPRDLPDARGYIDAAEAMIGSLLRNGDISGETLAEIEGTLGIMIVNGNRLLRDANASVPANGLNSFRLRVVGGDSNAPNGAGSRSTTGTTNSTFPVVHQRSQPDIYHSAFGRGGHSTETNPMECVFGGPSLTGGNVNYNITGRTRDHQEAEDTHDPLYVRLLPHGPSAALRGSMRAQSVLHPLFSNIELPPANSLMSDMISHNERLRRRLPTGARRIGDWTGSAPPSGGYFPTLSHFRGRNVVSGSSQQRGTSGAAPTEGLMAQSSSEQVLSAIQAVLRPVATRLETNAENQPNAAGRTDSATGTDAAAAAAAAAAASGSTNGVSESNGDQPPPPENMAVESGLSDAGAVSLAAELRESLADVSGTEAAESSQADAQDVAPESISEPPLGSIPDDRMATDGDQHNPTESNEGENVGEINEDGIAEDHPVQESREVDANAESNVATALACPPGFDEDVFHSLPREMQEDCISQYNATQEIANQIDGSTLDPEVLAELPEDMRREVIEQDRQQRLMQQQEQAPADPSHAQEMDSASIIASMAPELREEILMTLDESVLSTLPPQIIAEAQILRERASVRQRRIYESTSGTSNHQEAAAGGSGATAPESRSDVQGTKKKAKSGKIKLDADRDEVIYRPESLPSPISCSDLKALLRFLFLLSPVRPTRVLQRIVSNLCENKPFRSSLTSSLIWLLHGDGAASSRVIEEYSMEYENSSSWRSQRDSASSCEESFPPSRLYGAVPDVPEFEQSSLNLAPSFMRQRQGLGAVASVAGHLRQPDDFLYTSSKTPPVVATRLLDMLVHMCRNPKIGLHMLVFEMNNSHQRTTCFGKLLDLLKLGSYTTSSTTLEQLLSLLELCVSPLSHVTKQTESTSPDKPDAQGKEYVEVPRVEVSLEQLKVLCSTLRMESCRDTGFSKVNSIVRRLCRVEANRGRVLGELATVADGLGTDAYQDLRALRIRMERVVSEHEHELEHSMSVDEASGKPNKISSSLVGSISGSVSLSTSTSELKLLRVLQTLQALCNEVPEEGGAKKSNELITVTPELVHLLQQLQLDVLWDELSSCLKVAQVLEGIKKLDSGEESKESETNEDNDDSVEGTDTKHKTLRNSAAGLLARFLPSVEAFFVANACIIKPTSSSPASTDNIDNLVGGKRMLDFVSSNKVLLNALIRSNSNLLDKGMRALVQIPQFRPLLDFDVKRHWFKAQVKRLRQQASRRYGSLRLQIRRESVFQDAYFQLQPRNADEMRGRLNVTFRDEEGVDAGGLSREFFGILAKEIFNPNYALFTSTEDGCTFQPNPNSMINPDHLSYFRFVGRVVGKAVADGYLLDSHFTRSLYKHMLGLQPTHHDMEAIDPDYYGNLRTILENSLEDMGLDHLTFSIEDHSFGRNQIIDLIPNGRSTTVTDENKEEYVRLICQHRMTTSIKSQIKSYLDGFYEMVSPQLIAVFTPRELELLISGLPDIDVHDLKGNTDYVGWRAGDKEIGWFWNILFSLSRNEKAAFLQFVTGSSKVPLAGFAELQGMRGTQKFSIHKTGGSSASLMSAHTCFNSIDLPAYTSEEQMREKLLLAINEGGGAFGFA